MLAFISYVREDSPTILKLRDQFVQRGFECFIDTENLAAGEDWEARIRYEINRCDCFIACFSEHYSRRASTWMNREIGLALARHRRERGRVGWIYPVLLAGEMPELPEDLDPPLRMLNWTFLLPEAWPIAFGHLLAAIASSSGLRGAGVAELELRYTGARPVERKKILQSLKPILDLPEAISLLERGLRDTNESVRNEAACLLFIAGEPGAAAAARVMLDPETSSIARMTVLTGVMGLRSRGAPAVPAILKLLDAQLRNISPEIIQRHYDTMMITIYITALGEIAEPYDLIMSTLSGIRSNVPEIQQALDRTLATLR